MIIVLDTNTPALSYDQLTQLEGIEYLMRFQWFDREAYWMLNLYDQDENPIALSIKLVINVNLLRRFKDSRLPPGLLMCQDASGQGLDIATSDELGARVPLLYFTSDDAIFAPAAVAA